MKTNKLLIALSTAGALCFGFSGVAVAADSITAAKSATNPLVKEVTVNGAADFGFSTEGGHNARTLTGSGLDIVVTANCPLGHDVKLQSANAGFVKIAGNDSHAAKIGYNVTASAPNGVYTGVGNTKYGTSVIATNADTGIQLTSADGHTIHEIPANHVQHNSASTITYALNGDEKIEYSIHGTYADTITITVVCNS